MNQLQHIDFYPKWLGEPMYPAGLPLKLEDVKFEGISCSQLLIKRCEGNTTSDEERFLRDYVIYYINAPLFDSDFTRELTKDPTVLKLSLDDLIMKCLEYGLDPL